MAGKQDSRSSKTIWAYAYQLVPPQGEHRLDTIQALLDHAHSDAQRVARTWVGRVVTEQQITHILVVSDSPLRNRGVNRRLEAELKQLNVGFSVTAPLAVIDDAALSPAASARA
jgi:hypothetical protein